MNIKAFIATAILAASTSLMPAFTDPPIACNMKALSTEQRKQLGQLAEHVIAAITAARELPDGYAFRVDPAKASLPDVAQWLDVWRRCCPFYKFRLDFHAADAGLWLSVEGRPGVKEFIAVDSPRLAAKLPK
jgi:hypothetical protein